MVSKREVNVPIDLNVDDEPDENKKLKEFYESNLPYLMNLDLNSIHYYVIRDIAILLDGTKVFADDWKKYATEMGITDNYILTKIKIAADCQKEQELYIAMDTVLRETGSFGHIIIALLKTHRLDVLKKIQRYVRKLLESNPQTEVKRVESVQEWSCSSLLKSPEKFHLLPMNERLHNNSAFSISTVSSIENCTTKINPESATEQVKCEFNSLQQNSAETHHNYTASLQNTGGSSAFSESPLEESSKETRIPFPCCSTKDKLSVLVQHTELEGEIAGMLSAKLEQEDMIVTTLSDVNNLMSIDATNALNTIFQEVDFIVPIVSGKLMEEIYPTNYDAYLESTSAQINQYLYQLIMNEYRFNRCKNFRVRPVIVPGMKKQLLIRDVILSFSFRLWDEVPKLVRVLKETKQLAAQNLVH